MTMPPQFPGQPGRPRRGTPPPEPPTRRLPRPGQAEQPTEQLRTRGGDPGPTQRFRRPPSPADVRPTQQLPRQQSAAAPPPQGTKRRGLNVQSVILIAVIVVALIVGGLAGAELYARHRADSILVEVAECVVRDGASVSFGVNPPFLWQHITGHYTNISVTTAGDNVQDAKGMTAQVNLADVRLQDTGNSKGVIGSLDATLTWKSYGIKDTVAENLPGVGNLVTGVRTDPAAGTIVLEAGSASVTAKPVVSDGDLNLEVTDVTGPFPKDAVQSALNNLTKRLNDNYPLGIHADSVKVTDTGVVGKFSSQNASIPKEDENACFARL